MKLMRLLLLSFVCIGSTEILSMAADSALPGGRSQTELKGTVMPEWVRNFGLSYFSFFDGPGVVPGSYDYTPNVLGRPVDDGLRFNNYISLKYNLSSNFALDFQMRVQWVLNNANQVDEFKTLRWQSPRIGISGKLLSGSDWTLTGQFNTDFPYFFPQPIGGGVAATQRTTVFNPGLFARFSYNPRGSRWSVFSLVMPRFFVYEDRTVADPQYTRAGFSPLLKNEFLFDIAPSVNYALTQSTGLRLGSQLTYSKLIVSSWNPFQATLNNSSINSTAWRIAPIPIQLGITHDMSRAFSVSLFVQSFPIAAQRIRRDSSQATFLDTASLGMWISGTLI